jgi:large subunit ribosomal protein L2
MAIKQFKPTSPSRRGASVVSYKELDKVAPLKSLLDTVKKTWWT